MDSVMCPFAGCGWVGTASSHDASGLITHLKSAHMQGGMADGPRCPVEVLGKPCNRPLVSVRLPHRNTAEPVTPHVWMCTAMHALLLGRFAVSLV